MYWWSDVETNTLGEDLATCLAKYGTGKDYCPVKNMGIRVIFLDSTQSFGNSWLLAVTEGPVDSGKWVGVKSHRLDEDTYVLNGDPSDRVDSLT